MQLSLRVGAIGSLSKNLQIKLLKPLLDRSDCDITIDIGDGQSLLNRLNTFHLDVLLSDVPYSHSETEPLIQKQIAREPVCLVSRKISKKISLTEKLIKYGIYLPSKNNPITSEIEIFLKSKKEKIKIKGYIDDIALLRLFAIETDSVVAIPRVGVERELKNKTVQIDHHFKDLFQNFYLVLRRKGQRSQKILDLLQQN